ncbi:hypothetical protein [Mitsuaria sp. 7]|uniref:hypothetical protein n=1 Tax=Mitsuaria sp. 7 TaxID=1658665 RepID=UPI0007DCB919|nr:hypothetical protein [Mitsuaria sp. 7]ANH68886.1 hypothetical protein ABE85_17265 [Mitsuaria sp. 7]
MSKVRNTPAGEANRTRGYLWDPRLGDWVFYPHPDLRTLRIYQETAGKVYTVDQLRFDRACDDLLIRVPEHAHHLRLKDWYGDRQGAWRLDKIQYRNGAFVDVVNDLAPWRRLSELVSRDRLELPPQDASGGLAASAVTTRDERQTGAPRSSRVIVGTPGDDITKGTGEDDRIYTGTGRDRVSAGAGDDMITVAHGGSGDPCPDNKHIRGGGGVDTVDYHSAFVEAGTGIQASLAKREVRWGTRGIDRLINVENVVGTDAADRFEGDRKDNVMTGRKGDDEYVVTFGGGKDQIDDWDDTEGNVDTLRFGPGIRTDLLLKRTEGPDLVIQLLQEDGLYDTRVTIRNGTQRQFAIERFMLDDGSQFQLNHLGTLPFSLL